MSLQNNALIVTLSVSQWTARKLDKQVTSETNNKYAASKDAGRWNKLLVDKKFTEPISQNITQARAFHYDNTLPWGKKNNQYLLSSASYFEYITKMNEFQANHESLVAAFLANYDAVIADARLRLNGMFKSSDYPSRTEIEEKFGFSLSFFPVPADDFRVQIGDAEIEKLKEQMGIEVNSRLAGAVKDIWFRIAKQLKHMHERLSAKDAKFHDSLFDNLNELLVLLPKLNVTNDADINKALKQLSKIPVSPDAVRQDDKLRSDKAAEVQAVMNKFGNFFKS